MIATLSSRFFRFYLAGCGLALVVGCGLLTMGLRNLEHFPASFILAGVVICSAAASGATAYICFILAAKIVQSDIMPSVVRLSNNMADLRSMVVDSRSITIAHSSGLEEADGYGRDELLCILDGRPCRIYRDGQVDLETLGGTRRFASIEEARIFIGASGVVRIEPLA